MQMRTYSFEHELQPGQKR